jgi:hypothetical protein
LGLEFVPYYYLVFGFMGFVGMLHAYGIYTNGNAMAEYTAYARLVTGTLFYTLYTAGLIDMLGVLVAAYDILYAMLYLIGLKR